MSQILMDRPVGWGLAFRRAFEEWYVWMVLALGVMAFARRYPFDRAGVGRWLAVHFGAALLTSVAYVTIYAAILDGQRSIDGTVFVFGVVFKKVILHFFLLNLLVYWIVVLLCQGWQFYVRYHEREREASDLEKALVNARLEALRMQLNPHFLFNALNAVSALIHERPQVADRLVVRLSELLRSNLQGGRSHEVPLREELELLRGYLEIEEARFEERLKVEFEIQEEAKAVLVPSFVLQPLAENAIRHGIEQLESDGRLLVSARRDAQCLELRIRDNGPGLVTSGSKHGVASGIGLQNTRSRLRHLYGGNQSLELLEVPEGGSEVVLRIPWREAGVSQ